MIAEIIAMVIVVPLIGLGMWALDKYRVRREPRIEDTPGWETNTWIIRKDKLCREYNIPDLSRRKRNERRPD